MDLRLAWAELSACRRSPWVLLPWNATINSSLCSLSAIAASSDWLRPTLVLELLLAVTREASLACTLLVLLLLVLLLLLLLLVFAVCWAYCKLLLRVSLAGEVAVALLFLASTSSGNRSWIVFQSTVFMVQALPLLQQFSKLGQEFYATFFQAKCKKSTWIMLKTKGRPLATVYLISCLHFGHFFPHFVAAHFRHLMQKLRITRHRDQIVQLLECRILFFPLRAQIQNPQSAIHLSDYSLLIFSVSILIHLAHLTLLFRILKSLCIKTTPRVF